ncbi:acyl carrier protein [Micromonospora sp. HNM0581]|uniref:acyl carrier protein n=1 Tax=Micromonospora sp. HNM0581 TaxID=2716341 RepID=UPI00146D4CDF|nr:acyl carrier protein [Micromonospora sp. HNM0581]NLU80648.1 acyl carrier protein [Micromonospora sp. HNM0581]
MHDDIEQIARRGLAAVVESDVAPADLDPAADMADTYGLTSLNKVLFLTSVCEEAEVSLAHFTEQDVARMRTLGDVTEALGKRQGTRV